MVRGEIGLIGRVLSLLTLLVFAGCSTALGISEYRERERNRQTYETGTRMPARVLSSRVSKSTSFFGKVLVTSEKHYLSLEVEGAGKIRGEFEVWEAEYEKLPRGSVTIVVVEEGGRFLPEICRNKLLSDRGVLVWMAVALASGVGFLLGLADTLLSRARVRSPSA